MWEQVNVRVLHLVTDRRQSMQAQRLVRSDLPIQIFSCRHGGEDLVIFTTGIWSSNQNSRTWNGRSMDWSQHALLVIVLKATSNPVTYVPLTVEKVGQYSVVGSVLQSVCWKNYPKRPGFWWGKSKLHSFGKLLPLIAEDMPLIVCSEKYLLILHRREFFPSNARWLSPGRLSSRKDNCIVQIHRINAVATLVWQCDTKRELKWIDTISRTDAQGRTDSTGTAWCQTSLWDESHGGWTSCSENPPGLPHCRVLDKLANSWVTVRIHAGRNFEEMADMCWVFCVDIRKNFVPWGLT